MLGTRTAVVYVAGIVGNLVLASLLVPRDFGLVALGTVAVSVGTYLGDAGVGAALIRRRDEPSRAELQATNGLQLAVTGVIALLAAALAVPLGRDALVIAVMTASLPVMVLRLPSAIVLERRLHYRTIARADVAEALAYYAWAVGSVAAGLGVWGLASAIVVRAAAGTTTMLVAGPVGLLRPRWSWQHVRPLLGFGAKFQATAVLWMMREQGLNVAVGAIGGLAMLGVWNLAWRVLQIPNLLFRAIARIAYPAMSRLLETREDPRRAIERALSALAVITGALVVALVGFAPALPEIVGDAWSDVPAVLLWSGVALVLGAPITVVTSGYLYAADQPGAVARATLTGSAAWFGVTLPLLPSLGAPAVGVGWIACSVVSVALFWRATAAVSGAKVGSAIAAPTLLGLAGTAVGWLVADAMPDRIPGGLLGAAAGEVVFMGTVLLLARGALRNTTALVGQAFSGLRGRAAEGEHAGLEPADAGSVRPPSTPAVGHDGAT